MKSILILGSTGMLGYGVLSSITEYENVKISATVRSKIKLKKIKNKFPYNKIKKFHFLDVKKINQDKINALIKNYDYIINCIGVIKPEINISDAESVKNAIFINSVFPNMLAEAVYKKNKKIFQIATDCVFSGKKGKYIESSPHDDVELYGVTKSLGEIKAKNFYNIRTSIVGREFSTKKSLVEWFLNQNNVALKGFANHNWNGVTTKAFGEFLYTIIYNNLEIPNLIHVIPKNVVNKYQLLKIFKNKFKTNVSIQNFKAPTKVDRSLSTIYKKKLDRIWKLTCFKDVPTITKMLDLI
ncbi:sugar nucleotide-binding protein [Candidatus Pelagibacter sp.]|nr:sugar nucleotide-binding protein [Candidatus Pelagibacter sp.]|tara:strand:- start:2978 stop:3871 length:894 start_codon:yes stop_codon:yes gene_type:complete